MNPATIFKMKKIHDRFVSDHPKFPGFVNAVKAKDLQEGTVVAMTITYPDGQTLETNLKINASDIEAFHELANIKPE
ncbi:MAG: hypothetical protein K6A30_01450 [Lachnospiraceae bacterium]|nr:hypothetical protein [Lachnospiraceae bacterium]